VIAISHDMRFVAETFGRVVVMRAGRIVLDGTPADVFAEQSWGSSPPRTSNRRWRPGWGRLGSAARPPRRA